MSAQVIQQEAHRTGNDTMWLKEHRGNIKRERPKHGAQCIVSRSASSLQLARALPVSLCMNRTQAVRQVKTNFLRGEELTKLPNRLASLKLHSFRGLWLLCRGERRRATPAKEALPSEGNHSRFTSLSANWLFTASCRQARTCKFLMLRVAALALLPSGALRSLSSPSLSLSRCCSSASPPCLELQLLLLRSPYCLAGL